MSLPFSVGGKVQFPKHICATCPARERCTTSKTGRSVSIHPDEPLFRELQQRQLTAVGRAKLRERVAALAFPISYWSEAIALWIKLNSIY
ncbi:putative transposase (plasmid) [Calothrix brevissima NIES-22]|nr:putative transposase [Calothrix brevissima NIES-22]